LSEMTVREGKVPEYMSACVFCAATIHPEELVCSHCAAELRRLYVAVRMARDPTASIADVVREAAERIDTRKLKREIP